MSAAAQHERRSLAATSVADKIKAKVLGRVVYRVAHRAYTSTCTTEYLLLLRIPSCGVKPNGTATRGDHSPPSCACDIPRGKISSLPRFRFARSVRFEQG